MQIIGSNFDLLVIASISSNSVTRLFLLYYEIFCKQNFQIYIFLPFSFLCLYPFLYFFISSSCVMYVCGGRGEERGESRLESDFVVFPCHSPPHFEAGSVTEPGALCLSQTSKPQGPSYLCFPRSWGSKLRQSCLHCHASSLLST